MQDSILVTGGAGFIGSNFVLNWMGTAGSPVVNLDLLTYAGNPENLLSEGSRHLLVRGDICDAELVGSLLRKHQPRAIVHFAAESHVDRSIASPEAFIRTNVQGTFVLLEQAKAYWSAERGDRGAFRFLHVSTDEVYGTLGRTIRLSARPRRMLPTAPMRRRRRLPTTWRGPITTPGASRLTTNCSNNYGPFQFPEKLIPLMILNALEGKPLPVYGDGMNVRDWLFVEDHCSAIRAVLAEWPGGRDL
jgi:dTDP-glucose 4,6-dehydratase